MRNIVGYVTTHSVSVKCGIFAVNLDEPQTCWWMNNWMRLIIHKQFQVIHVRHFSISFIYKTMLISKHEKRCLQCWRLLSSFQTSEANRVVQKKTERLHAAIRSVLQRTVRTEPSGHSAAETALSRREIKESTQKQRQEAAGIDTKQRPRGKLLCKSSKENSYCFAHVSSLATIKSWLRYNDSWCHLAAQVECRHRKWTI